MCMKTCTCMNTSILFLTDDCQLETYNSQEKKCGARPYLPFLLSVGKKKEMGGRTEELVPKIKEQTKEQFIDQVSRH